MIGEQKPKEHIRRIQQEISAGFIVFRNTKEGPKFLILYHGHGYWNFPKGKIESEERSSQAALRETHEETGLGPRDLKRIKDFKAYEKFYFRRKRQPIYKIVIFYLAQTTRRQIRLSHEHQGYAWFLYPDAKKILGRYKDSLRVLEQARDFLSRKK